MSPYTGPTIGIGWEPIEAKLTKEQEEVILDATEAVEQAHAAVESSDATLAAAKAALVRVIKSLPADEIESSTGPEVFQTIIALLT